LSIKYNIWKTIEIFVDVYLKANRMLRMKPGKIPQIEDLSIKKQLDMAIVETSLNQKIKALRKIRMHS
jgi:hypothetical protein